MPRGNDKEALQDFADKFGSGIGNAEQLIEANLAMHPERLRKAELLPRDDAATHELRGKLDSLSGPNGERVIDAAVRRSPTVGEAITTIVYEDEAGRHHLGVIEEGKKKAEKPDLSAVEAVAERSPSPKSKDKS